MADAVLVGLSSGHLAVTFALAIYWDGASLILRVAGGALLVAMTVYNIVVVSHVFTHQRWFRSARLNRAVSLLNSVNMAQSVQAYELYHVRNHHRYHNDHRGADGTTKDLSSTFRDGVGERPVGIARYALAGAAKSLLGVIGSLASALRLGRVSVRECELLALASKAEPKRRAELRQVQLDRMAQFAAFCAFAVVSWRWTLSCYLPALFVSFALVNVQNYFEHHGASPSERFANSVSYYGRLYNFLTFNDGYHQEHHLRPQAHWSRLPTVRRDLAKGLDAAGRIVSPLPAILGFLDRGRA